MSDWQVPFNEGPNSDQIDHNWEKFDQAASAFRRISEEAKILSEDLSLMVLDALQAGMPEGMIGNRAGIDKQSIERIRRTGHLY